MKIILSSIYKGYEFESFESELPQISAKSGEYAF